MEEPLKEKRQAEMEETMAQSVQRSLPHRRMVSSCALSFRVTKEAGGGLGVWQGRSQGKPLGAAMLWCLAGLPAALCTPQPTWAEQLIALRLRPGVWSPKQGGGSPGLREDKLSAPRRHRSVLCPQSLAAVDSKQELPSTEINAQLKLITKYRKCYRGRGDKLHEESIQQTGSHQPSVVKFREKEYTASRTKKDQVQISEIQTSVGG